MIALKALLTGSMMTVVAMGLPTASYAGDMGGGYYQGYGEEDSYHKGYEHHHGYGEEDYHKGGKVGEKAHFHGHLRVDVYIHKVGEGEHKKHEGKPMKYHWMHAHHGGWEHEKYGMYGHHGGWDQSQYGYEHHGGWDQEKYGKSYGWGDRDTDRYGYEPRGDAGGPGDGGYDADE